MKPAIVVAILWVILCVVSYAITERKRKEREDSIMERYPPHIDTFDVYPKSDTAYKHDTTGTIIYNNVWFFRKGSVTIFRYHYRDSIVIYKHIAE